MFVAEYPIDTIIPLQQVGVSAERLTILSQLQASGVDLGSPVIMRCELPNAPIERLLLDGTHRAFMAIRHGMNSMDFTVAETDEDFAELAPNIQRHYPTLSAIRNRYITMWRPQINRFGIISVSDLPIHRVSKEEMLSWTQAPDEDSWK